MTGHDFLPLKRKSRAWQPLFVPRALQWAGIRFMPAAKSRPDPSHLYYT
jgi:hypothetical protein